MRLAIEKAQSPVAGGALGQRRVYPFADGPEAAIKEGVTAIVQPGGSIRDDEVFDAADAARVSMVVTGRRHFATDAAWELGLDVDVPPEEAWSLVGDPASVPRWYPKYVRADVDGDRRVLTSAEGAVLRERLLARDDAGPDLLVLGDLGAPVRSHRAGFAVTPAAAGAASPGGPTRSPPTPEADLEGRLSATQADALQRMKEILERG